MKAPTENFDCSSIVVKVTCQISMDTRQFLKTHTSICRLQMFSAFWKTVSCFFLCIICKIFSSGVTNVLVYLYDAAIKFAMSGQQMHSDWTLTEIHTTCMLHNVPPNHILHLCCLTFPTRSPLTTPPQKFVSKAATLSTRNILWAELG